MNSNIYDLNVSIDESLLDETLKGWLLKKEWEEQEVKAMKFIPPSSTVLELGGCIGITANVLNKKLRHPDKHTVVEANPFLIPLLKKIRDDNKSFFQIENYLMGGSEGKDDFFLDPVGHITQSSINYKKNFNKVQVPQATIKSIEKKHNLNFDCLVMDIEGAEYNLFERELFKDDFYLKLHTIMVEFHFDEEINNPAERYQNIIETLLAGGYSCVFSKDEVRLFTKNK